MQHVRYLSSKSNMFFIQNFEWFCVASRVICRTFTIAKVLCVVYISQYISMMHIPHIFPLAYKGTVCMSVMNHVYPSGRACVLACVRACARACVLKLSLVVLISFKMYQAEQRQHANEVQESHGTGADAV